MGQTKCGNPECSGDHHILENPSDPKFNRDTMMKALQEGTADADQQLAASNAIHNMQGILSCMPRFMVDDVFARMMKNAPPHIREAAQRAHALDMAEAMGPQGRGDN